MVLVIALELIVPDTSSHRRDVIQAISTEPARNSLITAMKMAASARTMNALGTGHADFLGSFTATSPRSVPMKRSQCVINEKTSQRI